MAFSAVTERGSATDKVSGLTVGVSPSTAIAVGQIAFAVAATDNTTLITGASTDHTSVTDTDGHTWAKVYERTVTAAGVAEDGVTASLWWTKVVSEIGLADTVTLTLGTARVAKVIGLFEATVDAGMTIAHSVGAEAFVDVVNAGNPGAATIAGLSSIERLWVGIAGNEQTIVTWTEDADYTNVYAAEGFSTTGGSLQTNISVNVGSRIATLTGDTFDISGLSTAEHSIALVAFEEIAEGPAAQNLTGTLFTKAPTFPLGVLTLGVAPPGPTPTPSTDGNRMGGTGAIRKPPRHR